LPPRKLNVKAQQHIDAIKNKRDEKLIKAQIEEERKRMVYDRQMQKAKDEVNKRKIQLGVSKGANEDMQMVLYQEPISEEPVGNKRSSMPA
jgi:hypothetical protein